MQLLKEEKKSGPVSARTLLYKSEDWPGMAPRRVPRVVAKVEVDVGVGERAAVRRVEALVDAATEE